MVIYLPPLRSGDDLTATSVGQGPRGNPYDNFGWLRLPDGWIDRRVHMRGTKSKPFTHSGKLGWALAKSRATHGRTTHGRAHPAAWTSPPRLVTRLVMASENAGSGAINWWNKEEPLKHLNGVPTPRGNKPEGKHYNHHSYGKNKISTKPILSFGGIFLVDSWEKMT